MENELQKYFLGQDSSLSLEQLDAFFQNTKKFSDMLMMYQCAIREIRTKFEILNDDLSYRNNRNPIEMIKSRVKKPQSILEKLKRRNLELSVSSVMENLNDVAGVRVICSFVDDIYKVAEMFTRQDDVIVLEVKDYIKNPKPNGYRSYHMIVEIPVFFADRKQAVKVEVQFRTIAMDFWASLEHGMKYKKDMPDAEELIAELKACADVIAKTDLHMQDINERLQALSHPEES
ncbi:MAG: GTP pyrophosphokinase family protein [Ruminococcaceae bacterium]|nr:GTP pyrophosphokinase family protein [Oscillospiraceae bacterium]